MTLQTTSPNTSMQASIATLLKELVEMPTVSADKAANRVALQWIKRQLQHLPLHITDFEHEGFGTLIVTTRPTKRPKVLLNAHIDVVPGSPELFVFREENGCYYGRGVFDMKYAAATYIQLLQSLGDRLPEYDLGVIFTTDEEDYVGKYGVRAVLDAGWSADVVIDPDANTPAWTIQRAAKGLIRYQLTCIGEAGHGSRPWMYHNAIDSIMDFFCELRENFPTEPCNQDDHDHSTLNIGMIQGGAAINQVADRAEAKFEIRIAPGDGIVASVSAAIEKLAAKHPRIHLQIMDTVEPLELDLDLDYVTRIQTLITQETGQTNPPYLAHGGSEASFYAAKGIPVLLFEGPGGDSHGPGEWISVDGVNTFATIIRRFVDETARIA